MTKMMKFVKRDPIRTVIYHNKYRDLSLDSVSKALLNEGKLENLDGLQIQKLSREKQLEYVAQDADSCNETEYA